MRRFIVSHFLIGWALILLTPTLAQSIVPADEAGQASLSVTLQQGRDLYSGPGDTYRKIGTLDPGTSVTLEERNALGTWLRISDSEYETDAWILRNTLLLDDSIRFSEIPVSTLRDANTGNLEDATLAQLYSVPILPLIHPNMSEVYQEGLVRGYSGRVVTKIGDSLSANPYFLMPLREEALAQLGPYDYLQDVVALLGPHIPESVASRIGLSSQVIFDAFWAERPACQPNESPLLCEYRLHQPSFALIIFGPNDVRTMTEERFADQMQQIVETSLAEAVIPVLFTFSCHPSQERYWEKSLAFNQIIIETAEAHQVPLVNLWAAARTLPEYGLDRDRIHLRQSGYEYLKYDSGLESRSGVSLLNLLTLHVLDVLLIALPVPEES